MKKIVPLTMLGAALVGAFSCADALAWGANGHRAVGAIADQLIAGTRAQQQVAALLLPGESLERISTWPDCVKGTSCGPQTQEMMDYVAANPRHAEYHFTNIPFQNAAYYDGEVGSDPDDIVQALKQAIATLQGDTSEAANPHHFTPRQALILLTHLAGDITEPLHVGAGYVSAQGGFIAPKAKADIDDVHILDSFGGNDFLLDNGQVESQGTRLIPPALPPVADANANAAPKAPAKPPVTYQKSLHSYWDGTVVEYAMRRVSARTPEQFAQIVIASKPALAANTGAVGTWPYQWANESLEASKLAYAGLTPGQKDQRSTSAGKVYNVWAMSLPDDYPVPSSAIAKTQLIKGGYQLAAVLQAIWPQQ